MKQIAWERFCRARNRYRREVKQLQDRLPQLQKIQQKLVDSRNPKYIIETPIVYNSALDDVSADSQIRLILVADNPGRREQLAENRRYLVGPSGKIAATFFRNTPSLKIDFNTNVIILNKTPIHTPRTGELKELCRLGGTALESALSCSQQLMAGLLLEFHQALSSDTSKPLPVWITGYSEMKKGGIFEAWTEELKRIYDSTLHPEVAGLEKSVFLYRHFSMNQFTIDLKRQTPPSEGGVPDESSIAQTLKRIGTAYREKYLW